MTVPPPNHDLVLLREHLYQDLQRIDLVLPPNVDDTSFVPVHVKGLGKFDYHLGPLAEAALSNTMLYCIAAACVLLMLYQVRTPLWQRSRSVSQTIRRRSSSFIAEHVFYDAEKGLLSTPVPDLSDSPYSPANQSPVYLRNSEVKMMDFDDKFGIQRNYNMKIS